MQQATLTRPQVVFLTNAMIRPITAYGGDVAVSRNLLRKGLARTAGKSIGHADLYAPTTAGIAALGEYHAKRRV